jgi:hypothetical protein
VRGELVLVAGQLLHPGELGVAAAWEGDRVVGGRGIIRREAVGVVGDRVERLAATERAQNLVEVAEVRAADAGEEQLVVHAVARVDLLEDRVFVFE